MLDDERAPVIVGIGEICQRDHAPGQGDDPLTLMELALRAAEKDAGFALVEQIDSLDVVAQISWSYVDLPAKVVKRIGATPRRLNYGPLGGETPIRFLNQAAGRIAAGKCRIAAVVGGEAQHSRSTARRAGVELDWPPADDGAPKLLRGVDYLSPRAVELGIAAPVSVYPLFENTLPSTLGQTPAQATEESAIIWSNLSQVAANNPAAWSKKHLTPLDIATPTERNRLIAWPYTKSMVANPDVNQSAALIVTSIAVARQLGIAPERMIHVGPGFCATEPKNYLDRARFDQCPSQEAVLAAAGARWRDEPGDRPVELYSCFPVVPKTARRALDLAEDEPLSVTGGLSFFGAPLNNYMAHAAAAMVRRLRGSNGGTGLLYAQGGYMTTHHALLIGTRPFKEAGAVHNVTREPEAAPPLLEAYNGPATLETFTILCNRAGQPTHAAIIARTPDGGRVLAKVDGSDTPSIGVLSSEHLSPVGRRGAIDGIGPNMQWRFQDVS